MTVKEPFFDENVTKVPRFELSADQFKILPSTDYPLMVSAQPPRAPKSVRRLSREPYYQTNSRFSRSASSALLSYAKFSDIFDYGYLDHFRSEEHENALVFDSDSDYDDECSGQAARHCDSGNQTREAQSSKNNKYSITEKIEELSPNFIESAYNDPVYTGSASLDSNDESDLEDYSVHMLTFRVNSHPQYTRPPRPSYSQSSDYFDRPFSRKDSDLPNTCHHPKFAAPKCKSLFVDSILPLPQKDLALYLEKCSGILFSDSMSKPTPTAAKVAKANVRFLNDAFEISHKASGPYDDYELCRPQFFI